MLRFFKDFTSGLYFCYKAMGFVMAHNLWPWFFVSAIVAGISIWLGLAISNDVMTYTIPDPARGDLPQMVWLVAIWFMKLLMLMMLVKLNKYVVLFILPPVLSILSEQTEKHIAGTTYRWSIVQFWEDIKRSLRIVWSNLLWEAGLIIAFIGLMLIFPGLKAFFPYYAFGVGLYFYGFSLIDYALERRRTPVDESKKFMRKYIGLTLSVGLVYSAFFMLEVDFGWFTDDPILENVSVNIGVIFAPVICVVAATMGVHKIIDLSTNPHAIGGVRKDRAMIQPDE